MGEVMDDGGIAAAPRTCIGIPGDTLIHRTPYRLSPDALHPFPQIEGR